MGVNGVGDGGAAGAGATPLLNYSTTPSPLCWATPTTPGGPPAVATGAAVPPNNPSGTTSCQCRQVDSCEGVGGVGDGEEEVVVVVGQAKGTR